jgi:hypothetical protein
VRPGMTLDHVGGFMAAGFMAAMEGLVSCERAGLEIVFVPEAHSFDAVSLPGFIAARPSPGPRPPRRHPPAAGRRDRQAPLPPWVASRGK